MRKIGFLGLGFQSGQERTGLSNSAEYVRNFFSVLSNLGLQVIDHGNIEPQETDCHKVRTLGETKNFGWRSYKKAYTKIKSLLSKPETLVNWGGDHSVALSTVGSFCAKFPEGFVVWIDAHADMNLPEDSPTGNVHGMPLAFLLNLQEAGKTHFPWIENSLNADKLIYVGLRDIDPFEARMLRELNIKAYTSDQVRQQGMAAVAEEIFDLVKNQPLHVSFDIDSISPEFAPSTGVAVPKGLREQEIRALGKVLSSHQNLRSVDVVEINPEIGSEQDVLKTYTLALGFLTSLLTTTAVEKFACLSNVRSL